MHPSIIGHNVSEGFERTSATGNALKHCCTLHVAHVLLCETTSRIGLHAVQHRLKDDFTRLKPWPNGLAIRPKLTTWELILALTRAQKRMGPFLPPALTCDRLALTLVEIKFTRKSTQFGRPTEVYAS